ncbi:hypothetical protein TVAG_165670 [Trichomonas vaginalis G3]|uniref:Surface antigen BspA-like n=1 Tax=Trichomonas vaginalis (strain ATCC PRA-98 / G3) TaxID=412133 RepID=A2DUP8_TRIV3|nr:ribonuclease inhibitor domain-containing protein [Trichomonas vaginalis G3]EAY15939.1 hypothetical protein TVAG_165670 [Trichomonas vaginalis G3]KAI5506600.1 ribonuclease inhibitor domain-containing protein [Trichomonas vaginalis G3]|eukprot:XP_001328162.1 hypothetical protein [Trichomonas vaginalis G3]
MYIYPPASPKSFVSLSDKVSNIENGAFISCSHLTSILIPDNSVVNIGHSAFMGCTHLRHLTIPLCVQSIGENAFSGCDSLVCVEFENKSSTFKTLLVSRGTKPKCLIPCGLITCNAHFNFFSNSISILSLSVFILI